MIWIVQPEMSHQIVSCNIHEEKGIFQLWVTRPNGKSIKIEENPDKEIIAEIKEAIDYAIEHKETTLRLV